MKIKKTLNIIKSSESTISILLGILVIFVVAGFVFQYLSRQEIPSLPEETKDEDISGESSQEENKTLDEEAIPFTGQLPTTHNVQKGEDLWKIALKYYGSGYNWVDIAQENKIENADLIEADTELVIPAVTKREPILKGELPLATTTPKQYLVVKGDYLWKIALRQYGNGYRWVQIARANKLTNPNLIYPGKVLTLP